MKGDFTLSSRPGALECTVTIPADAMTLRALVLVGVAGLITGPPEGGRYATLGLITGPPEGGRHTDRSAAITAGSDPLVLRTFDDDPAGAAPPGFAFAVARGAEPARWIVERQGDNGVLIHRGSDRGQGFALAVLEKPALASVEASVRLRLAGGARTGGLVWHYRDPDNYFLARLDLGVQDLALYRVVRGNRVRLEDEDDLELDPDAWYTLKVRHEGERIRIYLGGIKVIEEYDRSQPAAGRVGLWSADDSLGWFDDVRVGGGNGRRHEDSGR